MRFKKVTRTDVLFLSLIAMFFGNSALANKAVEAPFGLEWGLSKGDLVGMGMTLTDCKELGWVEQCNASGVPKSLSNADWYQVLVTKKYGLQKVGMVGTDISSDIYGSSGKASYSKLKTALVKKYGTPQSFEYVGRELWDEADEFYQCLAYDGCGTWTSYWVDGLEGTIALELKGMRRGEGYLTLWYEGGSWSTAIDEKDMVQDSADEDAL